MRLAFITPTKYLESLSAKGDFYLALAHLIDNDGKNEYARFHIQEKRRGRTVYLDNGLFEGAQVDPEVLIRKARIIGADVVCAPDSLYNSKETIKAFKSFIKLKQEEGLVARIMGIPQADNPQDWWDCFQFFDTNKDCDMIGLSILSIPKAFDGSITESRKRLIEQLYCHSYLSGKRLTPMHLLGLGESYADIQEAYRLLPREVVSNDSSSCYIHGIHGVTYNEDGTVPGGKIKTKVDFEDKDLNKWQVEAVKYNMRIARNLTS